MSDIGFLIIGAQKAGTTSLFEYMRRHPQIHMPADKELYFFNADGAYRRGLDWYLMNVLRGAPAGAVCGEATAEYMTGVPHRDIADDKREDSDTNPDSSGPLVEVIPRRIKHCLPNVKLICVLRDPVARAYSHYRMMVLDRAESRSFDDAIDQLLEPSSIQQARITRTRTNGYVVNGEYYRVLDAYLRVFPRDQLMVIFSDDLADRPVETLATVFDFVGVSSSFVPDNLDTRYLAGATKQRIPGLNLFIWRERLTRIPLARSLWYALPDRFRTSVSRTYGVAGYRTALWNARRDVPGDDMTSSARKKLISHYQPDGEALSDMLRRDIPWLAEWLTDSSI
jgi:hypothetical protein